MAMAMPMMPMPPSHCSSDRHSSSPGANPSSPEITVAPVAVSDDIASK